MVSKIMVKLTTKFIAYKLLNVIKYNLSIQIRIVALISSFKMNLIKNKMLLLRKKNSFPNGSLTDV